MVPSGPNEEGELVVISQPTKMTDAPLTDDLEQTANKTAYALECQTERIAERIEDLKLQLAKSSSEISSLDELIVAIHATEGNGNMVSGAFGPAGFKGKIVRLWMS